MFPAKNSGYYALLISLCLASCQSDTPAQNTATNTATTTPPETGAPATSTAWYRQYRTRLPGATDSVTVHLQNLGTGSDASSIGRVVGFYAGPKGQPFELASNPTSAPDSLLLREASHSRLNAGGYGAVWRLRRMGEAWVGTLAGQTVRLQPLPVSQGVAFDTQVFRDSVRARPQHPQDSVWGRISLHALLPTSNRQPLAGNMLHLLHGDTVFAGSAPTLPAIWENMRRPFFNDYQEDMKAIFQQMEADTSRSGHRPMAMLNYTDERDTYVLWNADNLLSLGLFTYSYAGGAHGNYGTHVLSFDTRSGRPLPYDAIFRPDAKPRLEALLARYARPSLGLKPNEPLRNALFEETLPVTRNVYLTSGGAVFVYQPYEVAAYAYGEVRVFVPLRELRPLLQPGLPLEEGRSVAQK
ncbi:DUF3298 and DUF4163 domain-containing protein [Hymenobacter profundi]|uniref:DUF3298 and DUF4163 domain-containing protein n=1 Tax=Hymenobacter profundi TaxID=1982110 RepID=A0ABS6X020_9BACT|nr:DUF3298 and DUF4163 domain-containing protein [Hymenobacter profundi]MBW3129174.1 DUF3298 and DUF4163 domain-containing protein [Hymenobacter profundi]